MSRFAVLLLIVFALGASFIFGFQTRDALIYDPQTINSSTLNSGTYEVTRVIDGDTVELANGVTVRYEGIDAPEQSSTKGKVATKRNTELVLGKLVRIEIAEGKDLYGRALAYVWLDNVMINELLIKEGFATPYFPPKQKKPKYWDQLETAEKEAQKRADVDE